MMPGMGGPGGSSGGFGMPGGNLYGGGSATPPGNPFGGTQEPTLTDFYVTLKVNTVAEKS
jgi:hypothetical protein